MISYSLFQFPQNHLKKLLLWLYLLFGTLPSFTLAATLHAIIMTDTTDSRIKASKDRENIKQWVANVSEATGFNLKETVIDGEKGFFSRGSHEKVKNVIEELPVMAKEDIVIFYYAGHGMNTDRGSRWPALDVEGEGTTDDQLIELSWVKEKLSSQSPRLLIAITDTCNEYLAEPSRGEGTILGGVGPYKEAYRKLFLGYQGIMIATGSIPEQKSFYNNEGGRFTQKFLKTLKEELKSTNPDWENIRVRSIEDIPVMDPKYVKEQSKQTPQMQVNVSKVALEVASEEENPLVSLSEPVKPEIVCPQQTSTRWWACSQNTEGEEGEKKWNVFVEEKLWYNRWTGWYWQDDLLINGLGHYISATTTDNHIASILTLAYRYDKFSAALSLSSGGPQSFSLVTSPYYIKNMRN